VELAYGDEGCVDVAGDGLSQQAAVGEDGLAVIFRGKPQI
jgi:hypothetical protein